jgi:hypothetical protein
MDFAFSKTFTPGILKFGYFMAVPGLLLVWAVLTGVGFHFGTWWGLGALVIAGPGLFIGGMLTLRVIFEVIIISIKAAEDIHALRKATEAQTAQAAQAARPTAPRPRPAGA